MVRPLGAMATPDYVDTFTIVAHNAADYPPEQWARVALEEASPTARFIMWQVLCGLRLEPGPSPDHVAGWKIAERGERWIRIEAGSWFMTCHAVVAVAHDEVSVALFVRYDKPIGRGIWPLLSIGHRHAMPGLLRHAARRLNTSA